MLRVVSALTLSAMLIAPPVMAQGWHGRGGYGGGWHHHGYGGHHGGGGWIGPAIGLGILGGALAGGAYYDGYSRSYGYAPYYAAPRYSYRCPPGYYFAADSQCWPGG